MKESINILGKEIPVYGICFYLGIAVAVTVAVFLAKRKKIALFDFTCCAIYVMIGAILGAKLLFIAVSYREIIRMQLSFIEIIKGGFVFYGGLIGGFLGAFIYSKQFKESLLVYLDVFATVLPLGHGFGRIGCFAAGCCYGIEYNGAFAHVYETSSNIYTPTGVPLFPVQIMEAICLFALFVLLFVLFLKGKRFDGQQLLEYALSYSVIRFSLEFLRGDVERGQWLGLSTSQWISVGLFALAIVLLILQKRKTKRNI